MNTRTHSRSPVSGTPSLMEHMKGVFKRVFMRPLQVVLVLAGMAMLLFSMQAHAEGPSNVPVSVSLSTQEISLQPGSELPVQIQVTVPPYVQEPIPISFEVIHSNEFTIDGRLQDTAALFSLSRELRIRATHDAPQGDYKVILIVRARVNGQTHTFTNPITVHVGPKSRVTYFTSDNTTLAPFISNIVFSQSHVEMGRNETDAFTVSFRHHGSSTDYLIRFSETPIGINAHIANATQRFVDEGQTVTAFVELKTTAQTAFTSFPLHLEVYDLVTGETTPLGTVVVDVQPIVNIEVSLPFNAYTVEQGRVLDSYLTLTNTEYGNQDVRIESSSNLIVPGVTIVNVPAKSSVSVPIQVSAGPIVGSRTGTLYVMNANLTRSVGFVINTVPASSLPVNNPDQNDSNGGIPTGLLTGVFSPIVGVIVLILAALLIFSKRFREMIKARLPKAPAPPKPTGEPPKKMEPIPVSSDLPKEN